MIFLKALLIAALSPLIFAAGCVALLYEVISGRIFK